MSASHVNGDERRRCVKVKICLGSCESPEKSADLWERRIGPPTIPEMERCGPVREPKPFLDRRLGEFRVSAGGAEDVSPSRWAVDCNIKPATWDDGRCRDGCCPP